MKEASREERIELGPRIVDGHHGQLCNLLLLQEFALKENPQDAPRRRPVPLQHERLDLRLLQHRNHVIYIWTEWRPTVSKKKKPNKNKRKKDAY